VQGQFNSKGAVKMGLATLFIVFKHSSLITERGEIKISRVFPTCKAAKKAQYRYYRTDIGTIIFIRRTKTGRRKYAIISD
jgi:hypothetical protein